MAATPLGGILAGMADDETAPAGAGAAVVDEVAIWLDAAGKPCDKDAAVRGEILQTLADGTTRSTAFTC
jgi:hypothetical protein